MALNYRSKLFGGGPGGGGSGSPGGSNTQVQFNNGGTFGGDSGLTYDAATDTLTSGILSATGAGSAIRAANGYIEAANRSVAIGSGTNYGLNLSSSSLVSWTNDTWHFGTPDVGLARASAGVLKVTSGGSNLGSLQSGNVTVTALATPSVTSPLTVNGTPGATTYGYKAVAYLNDGTSTAASAEATTATGNATLSATDKIDGTFTAVTNAAYYKFYRTTGNGALGETPPRLIAQGIYPNFTDIGAAGTIETPATTNTTGRVLVGDGSAVAPSVAFASAPGSGLQWYPADNGIFVNINGTGVARIDSGGVGVWGDKGIRFGSGDVVPPDTFVQRVAPATLQLGAPPNGSPVANTLTIGESGSGTNIAGGNGVIQSGAGTGSGAGSTLEFKTPNAHGSDAVAQTQVSRLTISQATNATFKLSVYNDSNDTYQIGNDTNGWRALYLSRATLGSKSKALTDGSPVTFATFTIADAAMYSGEIIYNVKAVKGTDLQVLASKVRFTAARVGTNYYVTINEVGTASTAVSTGTLTCPISISGTGGVISLVATADTSFASPDSLVGQFRFDSPDAGLTLTFP